MSAVTEAMLAEAKTAGAESARIVLAGSKKQFLDTFRGFVNTQDLLDLDACFESLLQAKLKQFSAQTADQAQIAADEYEGSLNSIETIGDRYEIVGKAKAGVFVRSVAHQIISGAFAVAGAVLQAGLGVVLPGVGSLIGAGVNAGIQHVVSYFLGD